MAKMEYVEFPHNHGIGTVDEVLTEVVTELQEQAEHLATPLRKTFTGHPLPSRTEVVEMVELLRSVIFPGYVGNRDVTEESLGYHMGANLHRASLIMVDEIHRGLCFACARDSSDRAPEKCLNRAKRITTDFLRRLPELRRHLALDAVAAYEGDPSAPSPSEAIFCYPGVLALTYHRIAHEFYQAEVPLIPRLITEHAHSLTGIDILAIQGKADCVSHEKSSRKYLSTELIGLPAACPRPQMDASVMALDNSDSSPSSNWSQDISLTAFSVPTRQGVH